MGNPPLKESRVNCTHPRGDDMTAHSGLKLSRVSLLHSSSLHVRAGLLKTECNIPNYSYRRVDADKQFMAGEKMYLGRYVRSPPSRL
jgi:hypothetical protein